MNVVDRVADARMGHAKMFVCFEEHERDEPGLPVVHVDDVRMLIRLQHELERGFTEEREPLGIIVMAIDEAAIEKILEEMRLNEEALDPIHEPKEDIAMYPEMMERHPKIAVAFCKPPNAIVTHHIVFGQDHLNVVPADRELAAQALDHIGQASDFGYRGIL
jgi:hypothetical protein